MHKRKKESRPVSEWSTSSISELPQSEFYISKKKSKYGRIYLPVFILRMSRMEYWYHTLTTGYPYELCIFLIIYSL